MTEMTEKTEMTEMAEMADPSAAAHLPGWDMQDKDDPRKNTHLWIADEALQMVKTLSGYQGAAAKALIALTDQQAAPLHQGIWDADFESPW
jgi:hypothetical protein